MKKSAPGRPEKRQLQKKEPDRKQKAKQKRSKQRKRLKIGKKAKRALLVLACVLALTGIFVFCGLYFKVRVIRVDGNARYSDAEITDMILRDRWSYNTLLLRLRYANRPVTDIPYIERIDVNVLDHETVRIIVYEKALAGYIEYLGKYVYFDRDGIVVESSDTLTSGVPQVLGLNYEHVVLYEPLPISNEHVFQQVLSITQLLEKYNLAADKIFFDVHYNTYLYFGDIEAELGDAGEYIDTKLEQLVHILPELEGERGILRMKDYTPTSSGITFEKR